MTRPIPGSTSTAASTSWSATSACGRTTCTGPTSTSSPGPTPTTPPGGRRCAASPTFSTCGSTPGPCPTRRCTIRSRTATGSTTHYPGDFIVEYIGQTRGWFYTLHVLATALFDRPAFKTCVAHGIVLGSDGQKMSKSLRNYPDVSEVFDRDGSDAMRWFLMASPILRGGNLIVTEQGIRDGVRQVLLPFWNAYSFLALYAPKVGNWRTDSTARAGSLHPGQAGGAARRPHRRDGCLRHLRGMRAVAPVHRGVDELVCATVTFAVLGGRPRRDRHLAHRARSDREAGRAAAAADHRDHLARYHR